MRSSEESRQEVARQLSGISHILQSIAEQASRDVKAEIEQATRILDNISSRCPKRLAFIDSDCTATSTAASLERQISLDSSTVISREFPIEGFTNIEVDCAFIFEVYAGDKFKVAVEANEGLFDYIIVAKSGDTLKLSLKPIRFMSRPVLEARVTMPVLRRLRQGAATKGIVAGFRSHDPLELYLSGAGALDMNLEAGDAKIEISGASRVTGELKADKVDLVLSGASGAQLSGMCSSLILSAWGAADLDLGELHTEESAIYLKGASQATVRAARRLDVDLSGASCLNYLGSPSISEVNLSGASVLSRVTAPE